MEKPNPLAVVVAPRQTNEFRAEPANDDSQAAALRRSERRAVVRRVLLRDGKSPSRLTGTGRARAFAFITRSTPIAMAAVRCETLSALRAPDHLREGMLEDAEKFVGHFRFRPQEGLQALHPFEVGNDHAAGVAENVRE